MFKRAYVLLLVPALLHVSVARAQAPQQYPIMDGIAQKIIDKYTNSTCEQLAVAKSTPPTGEKAEMEKRAILMLKSDPQMRAAFINKIAPTVVNKMFECGMIP